MFAYWLQGGRIDVGFLGAAQIDRHGNLNSTVIGGYDRPKVRLPGGGGAPEIATWCRETYVMLRQSPRTFVERLDFRTTVGRPVRAGAGAGVTCVVTDLGILEPDPESAELVMTALYPGVTAADARAATGWDLEVRDGPEVVEPPTADELEAIRALEPETGQTVSA
jgi:glutaconate CoA-transferase subunit B